MLEFVLEFLPSNKFCLFVQSWITLFHLNTIKFYQNLGALLAFFFVTSCSLTIIIFLFVLLQSYDWSMKISLLEMLQNEIFR